MPAFTYTGADSRYYPALRGGTSVKPGDVVELDEDPGDGRWESSAAPAPQNPPPSAPAPVDSPQEA